VKIDLSRYAQDPTCATPEGLKTRLMAELMPLVGGIGVLRNRVLVATYVRPNITAGGIILTDRTSDEDRWQGKVGLVLRVGPIAFDFDEVIEYIDHLRADDAVTYEAARAKAHLELGIPQVGDWVAYRGSETWETGIEVARSTFASCRFIFDDAIVAKVENPSVIY
jgi:co-chaperonin GroES (HSP10)